MVAAMTLLAVGCGNAKKDADQEKKEIFAESLKETEGEITSKVNTEPVWLVEPKYDRIGFFEEGMCLVMKDGKWGYIDETGQEVISPRFVGECSNFSGGHALVEGGTKVIDRSGNYVFEESFSAGSVAIAKSGEVCAYNSERGWYIDRDGTIQEIDRFDAATKINGEGYGDTYYPGMAVQERNRLNRVEFLQEPSEALIEKLDTEGKKVLSPGEFWNGRMNVRGNFGISHVFVDQVDKDMPVVFGKLNTESKLGVAYYGDTLGDDVAGKIGLCDYEGNTILEADVYDIDGGYDGVELITFCDGLLLVRKGEYVETDVGDGRAIINRNSMYGYIDKEGNEKIPVQYYFAEPFSEGLAFVRTKDEKKYISTEGEDRIVFPEDFKMNYATPFHNGFAAVSSDYLVGVICAPQQESANSQKC